MQEICMTLELLKMPPSKWNYSELNHNKSFENNFNINMIILKYFIFRCISKFKIYLTFRYGRFLNDFELIEFCLSLDSRECQRGKS